MREEDSFALDGIWIAAYLHKYASIPPQGIPTYRKIKASMVSADALKGGLLDICQADTQHAGGVPVLVQPLLHSQALKAASIGSGSFYLVNEERLPSP